MAALAPLACQAPPPQTAATSAAPIAHAVAPTVASPVAAPASVESKILDLTEHQSQVENLLRYLTAKIGPRLTSSHNLQRAEEWARDQFASWGLDARLEPWGDFAVGFDRGPSTVTEISPEHEDLVFMTRAWTAGTKGPIRGKVLLAPTSEEELAAIKDQLAGAWILVQNEPPRMRGNGPNGPRPATPPERTTADSTKGDATTAGAPKSDAATTDAAKTDAAKSDDAEAQAKADAEKAKQDAAKAKEDAAKAIEKALDDGGIAGRVHRPRGEKGDLLVTSGSQNVKWDALPTKVDVTIRGDQFDRILKHLKAGEPVELECNIDNRFFEGPVKQYNVIADLKGTEKPDEIVVVGGHIDSWDGAQGAQDNGTGTCTTLEAARLLAVSGAKPKRTIRFMLWSGEEQGLFGSRGYVKDHDAELANISAVLVHDGGTNYCSGIRCTPEMEADMRKVFAPVMDWEKDMPFAIDVGDGIPNSGDSDHASFISKGVPGFFWNQTGTHDYNFVHHTQNDTFENADQTYQRHSAGVIAIGALGIANLDHLLSRENMKAVEPRRMGIFPDGMKIASVMQGGAAEKAGWKEGDVILAVDGVAVTSIEEVSKAIQKGDPTKTITLQRGADKIETKLDWSDSPGEKERADRAKKRAEASAPKHN